MTHPAPQTIHTQLGPAFYDAVTPARFPRHILRYRNQAAADQIGLAGLSDDDFIDHFARFTPLPGTLAEPLALRYHGHQFGTYNPELGDGRGFLFAQYSERQTGRLLDLGTKGSGRTPYARTADGRLTLKGGVREVLATELLSALDVPTSQTFSLIETGEDLHRHDEPSPTRSSVLVRLSHSHIRIGSFQRLSYLGQTDNLELLLRHTVRHYYPDIDPDQDYEALILAFLPAFALRVSDMVAGWMVAGFVHGVLNTDNFNITGKALITARGGFCRIWTRALPLLILIRPAVMPMAASPLRRCGPCVVWRTVLCRFMIRKFWPKLWQGFIRQWNIIWPAAFAGVWVWTARMRPPLQRCQEPCLKPQKPARSAGTGYFMIFMAAG